MFGWNKDSDWLPLGDAKAQVEFFEDDLKRAQSALTYVLTFPNKNWPGYNKMVKILTKDVYDSYKRLAKARLKLIESQDLEAKTGNNSF